MLPVSELGIWTFPSVVTNHDCDGGRVPRFCARQTPPKIRLRDHGLGDGAAERGAGGEEECAQ
jgi:hypothetical protein